MVGRKAARGLLKKLGSFTPPLDVESVCSFLGYDLRFCDLGKEDGLFVCAGGKTIIIVNDIHRGIRRQRFTTAHEIGHAYMGHCPLGFDSSGINSTQQQETQANNFAAELLIPKLDLCRNHMNCSVQALAHRYQVSKEAMRIRLEELGLR